MSISSLKAEVGAGWTCTSAATKSVLLTLDDPPFGQPVYAGLFQAVAASLQSHLLLRQGELMTTAKPATPMRAVRTEQRHKKAPCR